MKYTRSLSRLNDITDMKIAQEVSELDRLLKKIDELESLRNQLKQEREAGKAEVISLINSSLSKIADYYKLRSAIAALNGRILIIETRIESVDDNIKEILEEIDKINAQISFFRKKKKKFEKLLSGDL